MIARNCRLALLVLLVTGCASSPPRPSDRDGGLYEGQPRAVFGTELPAGSPEEAMHRADGALRRGELDLALYLYLAAVEMDDAQPEAFYQIARVHARRGNAALAAKALGEVLARAPGHARALEELGALALAAGRHAEAEDVFQRALAADSQRARVHDGLGVLADLRGDHARAAEHFTAALALAPDSIQTMNNLGYSYYLAGDWARAEQTLRNVLALDSGHALAARNLGLLAARQERYAEALALLTRVMAPAEAHNDIGYILMLEGRHDEAAAYLREAVRLSPSYYETAYANLARNEELIRQRSAASPAAPPEPAAVHGAGGARAPGS